MAVAQVGVLIYNNIDFYVKLISSMVSLDALDVLDGLRKAHCHVEQDIALVGSGSSSGKIANVSRGCAGPIDDDVGRK